jgi:uncharacterized protein (DUF2235 family)
MKRLVVCFDGTWNAADSAEGETNVAKIARAVRANSGGDGVPQLVLYLRGVGTSGSPFSRLVAGATGAGIDDIIRSAYMFLAQNYVPQSADDGGQAQADEIFLFGFSRGAFAARSLAGLLGSCGLLKRQALDKVLDAWTYYRSTRKRSPLDFATSRKAQTHQDVTVRFLGVWDTVGSLGVPVGVFGDISQDVFAFHDTSPSRVVRFGAHALAIDEFRDEFVPTLWTGEAPANAVIKQVWFAGSHSDVGGGYKDGDLARIPLAWMAEQARSCGLKLDEAMLPDASALNPLATRHEARTSWSAKDLLTPTIRRVCGVNVPVAAFERLYFPMSKQGKPIPTIGEAIHHSVLERLAAGRSELVDGRPSSRARYRPKNLEGLVGANSEKHHNISIDDTFKI